MSLIVAGRYPLEDLARVAGITLHRSGRPHDDDRTLAGLHQLADRLGITHRQARRCLAAGLTDRQADRFAIRLGRHPASIWAAWWDGGGSDAEWFVDDPALDELEDVS